MSTPRIVYRNQHPAHNLGRSARRIFDQVALGGMTGPVKHRTVKSLVDAGLAKWTKAGHFTSDGYWQPRRIVITPAAHARWRDYKTAVQQIAEKESAS